MSKWVLAEQKVCLPNELSFRVWSIRYFFVSFLTFSGASRSDPTTTAINDEIKKEQDIQEPVKILLLGAGESGIAPIEIPVVDLFLILLGKSTFAKQIKIIHCGGFTEPEMYLFKEVIGLSLFIPALFLSNNRFINFF